MITMKIVMGFLIFLAIIIEATLVSFPFTLLFIALIASIWSTEAIYWSFLGGLVLDIFAFRLLGISSIFFLAVVWFTKRFKKKFHQGWVYYQFFILIIITVFYSLVIYRHIDALEMALAVIAEALILFVLRNLIPSEDERKKLSL